MSGRLRGDGGFASIVLAAAVAVLLVGFGGAVVVVDLHATGGRARTAADLAALAAAGAAVYGPGIACAQARAVAHDNGGALESCRLEGAELLDADVVVAARPAGPLSVAADRLGLAPPVVRARSLAGPARSR